MAGNITWYYQNKSDDTIDYLLYRIYFWFIRKKFFIKKCTTKKYFFLYQWYRYENTAIVNGEKIILCNTDSDCKIHY